jgi:U32 family peptidase
MEALEDMGEEIGRIFDYFERVGVIAIELSGNLKVGDSIRIVGGETDFTQNVDSMQIEGKSVTKAKKGDRLGIKVNEKCHKGYKVYKI